MLTQKKPNDGPDRLQGAPRRRWLVGGLALAAGLGGAGLAWWTSTEPPAAKTEPVADDLALWKLQALTPTGAALDIAAFRGKPLLLNFWATWCPPCIEELPLLNRFYNQNSAKGWQVLGLAVDQATAVRSFLERRPLDFPTGMAGLGGVDLSKSLGNLSGGLPFTVVIGAKGNVLNRKMGRVTEDELTSWAALR